MGSLVFTKQEGLKMENCMYWDGFVTVEKIDDKKAFIASLQGNLYIEISMKVARYLVERLEGSMKNCYKIIDRIVGLRK